MPVKKFVLKLKEKLKMKPELFENNGWRVTHRRVFKDKLSNRLVSEFLDSVLSSIAEGIKNDDKVKIVGFGIFKIRKSGRPACKFSKVLIKNLNKTLGGRQPNDKANSSTA